MFLGLKPPYKLAEDAVPVALAGSVSPDLGRNHRNDADDLRLRGKPVWIDVSAAVILTQIAD